MARRRRKNPFDTSSAGGIVVLAVGAFAAYELYKGFKLGEGLFASLFKHPSYCPKTGVTSCNAPLSTCNPTGMLTTATEGMTGQSPVAGMHANGQIQMPDGSIVNANCYPMSMIPGTQVAEVQTASGPVYLQSGHTNAQDAYIATQSPPSCGCYSQALQSFSCCE